MEKTLFAFATKSELLGVFPELAHCESLVLDKIINYFEMPQYNAIAAFFGVGTVDFSAGLTRFLLSPAGKGLFAVVLLGICGAYPQSKLPVGSVVNIISEKMGDMGFQESDGSFTSWNNSAGYESQKKIDLLETNRLDVDKLNLLPQVQGLTVNCCTGTAKLAADRSRTFDCSVESMEGAAAFATCNAFGLPLLEIRAVSNIATTRNKSAWNIEEALEKLRTNIQQTFYF